VPFPHKISKLIIFVPINIHIQQTLSIDEVGKKGASVTKNKTKELDYALTNY